MVIPSFPAQIADVSGMVGSKVTGTLLRVTVGSLTLTGHLDPSSEEAVRIGQHVEVLLEDTGKHYPAEVAKIGRLVRPKQDDADGSTPYIPVVITARQPWSTTFTGQDARITVTAAATNGKVLAVPVGAITAPADGQTSVTVIAPSGERRRVPVTAGMSADGYVEVEPTDGRLQEGENVVVGR
jgi:hypothetical protein